MLFHTSVLVIILSVIYCDRKLNTAMKKNRYSSKRHQWNLLKFLANARSVKNKVCMIHDLIIDNLSDHGNIITIVNNNIQCYCIITLNVH